MAEAPVEAKDVDERLKASLWFAIGKIVDDETIKLGINASPQFIGALTEMVWAQIENATVDMEVFARHANRSTIHADDVLLLARRNEGLEKILRDHLAGLRKDTETAKRKRPAK